MAASSKLSPSNSMGATRSGRSARMSSPRLMSRLAKSPRPISTVGLTSYRSRRRGFGIRAGWPGVLTTFATVEGSVIHSHWVSSSRTGCGTEVITTDPGYKTQEISTRRSNA
jgi:hypothetical protein